MMRKYIILILCSLLVLGIAAGCGDSRKRTDFIYGQGLGQAKPIYWLNL